MLETGVRRWLWALAWAAALALGAANLWLGDLNQDEGWYLYAARLVSEGRVLYRDFAFPQGPVMPLLYSVVHPVVEVAGVAGGRLFTALLGVLAALLASSVAARLVAPDGRRAAALLTFILVLVNVYQSYYFTVVKTYSAAALFLAGSVFALSAAVEKRGLFGAFAAGGLAVLAAGTRTSAGAVLPVMFLYLLVEWRRTGYRGWLAYGAGAAALGLLVLLPFLVLAWEQALFFMVQYHTLRRPGALLSLLVYKAGFLSRLAQAYFVALVLGAAVWLARRLGMGSPATDAPRPSQRRLTAALWAAVAAITLVHLSAPFPYDDYQVFVYPLFAAGVAAAAVRLARELQERAVAWLLLIAFVASLAAACASPINQEWFLRERDRIWWRLKDQPSLARLRDTARTLRALTRPGDQLLTQDPYLAVEAGLRLPHGLELGQFSYFPAFDRERALRLNVLNREMFLELLADCPAPAAALSGYAFAIESPDITPVPPADEAAFRAEVERRYDRVGQVPHFGQALTDLTLYRRKDRKDAP